MWIISIDPGPQQNRDMKPSVCKIALKVVTKRLELQDMAVQDWEDGYKDTADVSGINCWFVEVWNC